jgi:dipeptidyl aminopeptidase/acylaminoacyl peptidase
MTIRYPSSILALALLTCAAPAFAAPRAITHEDLWLMPRVGSPVVSPDGRWVVVPVNQPSYDEKLKSSDLWLVAVDGNSPPKPLTQTLGSESGVSWSRDSQRIVFSAKRGDDEVEQIYLLDLAGGEARRLTTLLGGARNAQFSPDGRKLAFETSAWPGTLTEDDNRKAHEERKARKYNARVYTGFPIRYWDRWLDGRQPRLLTLALDAAGNPAGAPRDLLANTALVRLSGFAGRRSDSGETLEAAWAPDGQSLVFTASINADTAAYAFASTTLFSVPAAGGEPRALTGKDYSCGRPVFAPDGARLLASCDRVNGFVYNLARVVAMNWPQPGQLRELATGFDRSVSSFAISADSKTVWLTAEDSGNEKLYSAPVAGGAVRVAIDLRKGAYSNLAIAAHAKMPILIANFESAVAPREIVRLDATRGQHQTLTNFAVARAQELELAPAEAFWTRSSKGRNVHSYLIKPPGFDANKKYPLFVVIHGGPHTMWRDEWVLRWNYHMLASPGYVVLLTNYSGSTGFGEEFSRHTQGDPLRSAGEEINAAADEAIKRYAFIDSSRQCAGGASYGGHLANWLQATTTRYRCLISHAGLINLESQFGTSDSTYPREIISGGPVWEQGPVWREQNPIRYAGKFATPVLVTIGEQDFRVPLNNSLEYWTILQRRQIESRLVVFPEENHWVLKGEDSRFFFAEIHAWLARWLK